MASVYDFKVEGIRGDIIDFAAFKGKKIMVVNVASECGFTPQYAQLQDLHSQFGDHLVVLGFPSNEFGNQEPGLNSEIHTFCTLKFGVTFPLGAKIKVTGNSKHPLYQWLTQKSLNGRRDSQVDWNFQKYIIDESGELIAVFPPSTDPCSDEVLELLFSKSDLNS